jgi:plasmid maintenance system antidote protein VapI
MNNVIAEQFRAALNFLLHQEGRGAQVRLSVAQDIDRGYLNAVIKGRKPGAEEIRLRIADHFGMTYEAMLTLGRAVQDGIVMQRQGISQPQPSKDTQSSGESYDQPLEKTKSEALQRFLEVLNSETEYSIILREMINTFYNAMKERQGTSNIIRRLEMLEERMGKLESS